MPISPSPSPIWSPTASVPAAPRRSSSTGTRWDNALVELFSGRLIAAAFCGLMTQALPADPAPSHDEVVAMFRRCLT